MNYNVKDGVLRMTDDAERNKDYEFAGVGYDESKSLSFNMEFGYGNKILWYNQPRPFLHKTIKNMKKSNSYVIAMRLALQKRLGKDVVK